MTNYIIQRYYQDDGWLPTSRQELDAKEANYILSHLSSIDPANKYRLVPVNSVNNDPIEPSSPLFHSERPWEVLRDTIIVNRPYNDPTEFQIVAVVDASECGLEAAKDNAKFIVEAVNNYPLIEAHKEWVEQMKDPKVKAVYDRMVEARTMPGTISRREAETMLNNFAPDNTITVNKHHYEQMETLIKQLDNILLNDNASNNSKVTCCAIRMFRYQNGSKL